MLGIMSLLSIVVLLLAVAVVNTSVSIDNDVIAKSSRGPPTRRSVRREILSVLGLDHVPRAPAYRRPTDLAVADYMMSLYRTAAGSSDYGNDVIVNTLGSDDQPTQMEKAQLEAADTIISFADQGISFR